ncbi:GNAT family N-acetyltransferase [Amycolatopsis sp. 3B14]|uniref:GNAT family N-acetyltransferase n=1 Tax=Amycolatopsis sp. 3B14 TaxID=3243600 RepID=UPI003D98A051
MTRTSGNQGEDRSKEDFCFPRKLDKRDEVNGFQSGAEELDEWLSQFARVNQKANNAVTYVTTTAERRVVGYYAITVAGVSKQNVPSEVAGNSPPADVPCVLLARLAVDWEYQERGIGAALFADSLQRAVALSQSVGVRAFLIHARDEDARRFYMKHADLFQSPTDPLHLMIPIHLIRAGAEANSSPVQESAEAPDLNR